MNGNTSYKILIVDDDKFLLNMYSIKFQKEKFEVVTATDGSDALKKLQEGFVPDAIVLDIVMPIMDGIEFLEKMRAQKLAEKTAVLILSNQGQSADIEKAKAMGIDGYIVKATTIPAEVVAEVMRMLAARKK
jgi:CheY-like chemotaxis protein